MPATRPRWIWDIVVAAGANAVRLRRADATEATATVATGTYRVIGSVAGSDLLLAVKTAFEAAIGGGFVLTPSVLTTTPGGRVRLSANQTFGMLWTNAATTWDDTPSSGFNPMGFVTSADDTGASFYDADNQHSSGWYPDTEPERDDGDDESHSQVSTTQAMGGIRRTLQWGTFAHRNVTIGFLERRKVFAASATQFEDFRTQFYAWARQGRRLYYYADATATTGEGSYVIRDEGWMENWPLDLQFKSVERYRVAVPMQTYVT